MQSRKPCAANRVIAEPFAFYCNGCRAVRSPDCVKGQKYEAVSSFLLTMHSRHPEIIQRRSSFLAILSPGKQQAPDSTGSIENEEDKLKSRKIGDCTNPTAGMANHKARSCVDKKELTFQRMTSTQKDFKNNGSVQIQRYHICSTPNL